MAELLLEIGLEEVPARMLAAAEAELGERVRALLERERLQDQTLGAPQVQTYSTPRRLAVWVRGVATGQADVEERLTGPAWGIAFKNGVATPAAQAFAKKAGVDVAALQPLTTPKGEYCSATVTRAGRAATEVLSELIPKEIAALSWPKPMYWRPGKPERFVRPLQWLVALLDDAVVPMEFAGVHAGRLSYGHRILHGDAPVLLESPARYGAQLRAASVMVQVAERRHTIRKALDRVTREVSGARWREDEALVETVTHLTEWPTVLLGSFASEYLALPEEVLVTVMRDHQKYFAVEDAQGSLAPYFLAVLNTEVDARGEAIIRHGNERVLRARFNDAQFFWSFDQKTLMADRVPLLEKVAFHKELGSYRQKTERTAGIARKLAALVQGRGVAVDVAALDEAALLAKVDLTTELVKEFTELQGIVGGLYVRHAGSKTSEKVAQAIYWQYMPASISDAIPPTVEGQLLGLADRVGTIVDMFGIGLVPSGSKDPYALRRAANAVVKILAVSRLPLGVSDLQFAAGVEATATATVTDFMLDRLSFYLRELELCPADVTNAVLAAGSDDVTDALARGLALKKVRGADADSGDMAAIAAAWKRTRNILRQAAEKQLPIAAAVDPELLQQDAEQALWRALQALVPVVEAFRTHKDYQGALEAIASLRPEVDLFFDQTLVMVEDAAVRGNRLALLQTIVSAFGSIADFSELVSPAQGVD